MLIIDPTTTHSLHVIRLFLSFILGCDLDCSPATCCCGGFGCCRQKISGTKDSVFFVASGGTPIFANLEAGETVTVDSASVTMIENTVTLGIVPNGRICMCCFGGEGCCSTTLTGPGKVFMQVSVSLGTAGNG
jgi:uncharacterized protein (AIM24 family)